MTEIIFTLMAIFGFIIIFLGYGAYEYHHQGEKYARWLQDHERRQKTR